MKELLSAYYDDELSSDKRAAVTAHLAGCNACAGEIEEFRSLSTMAEGLVHPEPPALIWRKLEEQLDGKHGDKLARPAIHDWLGWTRRPVAWLGFTLAATIILAVMWFGSRAWFRHEADHQMAAVFGEYLEEFHRDPSAAQQLLLANYGGRAVNFDQGMHEVGYRPVVAEGMPDGYLIEATYVMKMPCCTCVQCLCRRSDGTTIAIFEHDEEEPEWFAGRLETEAICNGRRCSIVELDDRLVATWQQGKRYITVVGVRDMAEVDRLVAWFDDRRRSQLN